MTVLDVNTDKPLQTRVWLVRTTVVFAAEATASYCNARFSGNARPVFVRLRYLKTYESQ